MTLPLFSTLTRLAFLPPNRAAFTTLRALASHGMMRSLILTAVVLLSLRAADAAELPGMWAERVKSVVAVEFYIESETERRPTVAYGTVIDDRGTIILPPVAVNPRTTPSQLKDFKVYRPSNPTSVAGEYLGQDALT